MPRDSHSSELKRNRHTGKTVMAIITVEQENTSREYDVRTLMQMVQTH